MTKDLEEVKRQLKFSKIIESEAEKPLYEQVCQDLLSYLESNSQATFQQIIKYVNGSDRRTLRMLDQLVKQGVLEFKFPYFKLAQHKTPSALTPDTVRCPTCDAKMINLAGALKPVTAIMERVYQERFTPTFIFDQRPVNYETTVRRAGYMILRGDIRGKRVAVLGDDDLTSVALGLTQLPKEVVVFDIDKRVVEYIGELADRYNLKNLKALQQDLTKTVPREYREQFDVFTTDPTPTSKPFATFINVGLQILKKSPRMAGYASIYPSCKLKDLSLQQVLTSMGLMITDLVPYWTQYEYIKHTYSEEDLELERQYAAKEGKISFYEYLLRFETTEDSKALDLKYSLKDIIGTATERVLKNPSKDPALGAESKDKKYVKQAALKLKKEIANA